MDSLLLLLCIIYCKAADIVVVVSECIISYNYQHFTMLLDIISNLKPLHIDSDRPPVVRYVCMYSYHRSYNTSTKLIPYVSLRTILHS